MTGCSGAQRTANAGQADVDAFAREFARRRAALDAFKRGVDFGLNLVLEFVNELAGLALGFFGRSLEPEIVDLSGDAVFTREPPVAEEFVVALSADSGGFRLKRREQVARRGFERGGRVVRQFEERCTCVELPGVRKRK